MSCFVCSSLFVIIFLAIVLSVLRFRDSDSGADPGFQVRGGGAHLKKLRRVEEGAKIFGYFV